MIRRQEEPPQFALMLDDPPSIDDLPLEHGSYMHGEVIGFTKDGERAIVALINGEDFCKLGSRNVKIKFANLKRVALKPKWMRWTVHGQVDNTPTSDVSGLKRCLTKDPLSVYAMGKLSNAGIQSRNYTMAVKWQRRAVANAYGGRGFYNDGERVGDMIQLANCYGELGDLEKEGETLQRVVAMVPPNHRETKYAWANHLFCIGKTLEAVALFEEIVHAPYVSQCTGEFQEHQETLVQLKVMAQKNMVEGLCKEMDENGFLNRRCDDKENYELGLSYANRILAIPNVDLNSNHHANGSIRKALALALIQYNGSKQETTKVCDSDNDQAWLEIQCHLEQALGLCRNPGSRVKPSTKGTTLEMAALIWKLRGDYYSEMDNKDVTMECLEMSDKLTVELRNTDTTTEPTTIAGPGFLINENFSFEDWRAHIAEQVDGSNSGDN